MEDDCGASSTSPPMRIEPCKECDQRGIVPSSNPQEANPVDFPHVAIIGGGLGGLALGLACQHRGIPFEIFERDTSFSQRSQGYGLTMQQASRALASFGLTEGLQEGITSTKHIVHTIDGSMVGEWGLRKWGRDQGKKPPKRQNVHIARQALRHELLEALLHENKDCIRWGHRLVNISQTGPIDNETSSDTSAAISSEVSTVHLHFEEINEITGEIQERVYSRNNMLVVGADGIRSSLRKLLPKARSMPLRYLDCVVVLGICKLQDVETACKMARESELLDGETVFQTADGSTRIYMMPFSSAEYMWQLSFPMQDEDKAKELSKRGPAALKAQALDLCRSWHSPIPQILEQTPTELVSGYPVYDRDLITEDFLESDLPLTLLGDAAHPMSPFKGQGANQALLDALSLARALVSEIQTKKSDGTVSSALKVYHQEMTARSAVKVRASARAVEVLHSDAAILEGNCTRGARSA